MSAPLASLRQLLQQRFPDAAPLTQRSARPVGTGLEVLDRALPGGGLPRGKLTVWTPLGGALAVLRAACQATIAAGERAVWIDTAGTAGPDWPEELLLVRPVGPDGAMDPLRRINALRSAEVLLRSGGFALVVLSGADPHGKGTETVRLTRAARDGGAAFVTLAHNSSMAALRVTSRILPHSYRWHRGPFTDTAAPIDAMVEIRVRALGWNERARVTLPITPYELRLSLDPGLADRRGVERGGSRRGGAARRPGP